MDETELVFVTPTSRSIAIEGLPVSELIVSCRGVIEVRSELDALEFFALSETMISDILSSVLGMVSGSSKYRGMTWSIRSWPWQHCTADVRA